MTSGYGVKNLYQFLSLAVIKATTMGRILFLVPQVVALNISSPGHLRLWNKSLYDGVRISVTTHTGGLKGTSIRGNCII